MINTTLVDGLILVACIAVLFICGYLFIARPMRQLKQTVAELQTHYVATKDVLEKSQQETANLSRALRSTQQQGHWGELQLRRIVEMVGMLQYCDFDTQVILSSMKGDQRPDLLIRLHDERVIVVDAKAPLISYIEGMSVTNDAVNARHMRAYTERVRDHIRSLSKKEYWQHFQPAPAFVVLFLPNEAMFRAALESDLGLLDFGTQRNIILASPITLIALLKTIAYGWSQENRAKSVQQIVNHSQSLNEEMQKLIIQWNAFSKPLSATVLEYNKLAGIYSDKVLPILKRIRALDGTFENGDKVLQVNTIQIMPKELQLEDDMLPIEN